MGLLLFSSQNAIISTIRVERLRPSDLVGSVDDPSGETQTILFRQNCDSIDDATAVAEKQVNLSLTDGFLHNKMGMI